MTIKSETHEEQIFRKTKSKMPNPLADVFIL